MFELCWLAFSLPPLITLSKFLSNPYHNGHISTIYNIIMSESITAKTMSKCCGWSEPCQNQMPHVTCRHPGDSHWQVHYQLIKLQNAVTFQILHHVVTFDEKWQNWPILVISHTKLLEALKYLWLDIMKIFVNIFFFFGTRPKFGKRKKKIYDVFFFRWWGQFFLLYNVTCMCNTGYSLVLPSLDVSFSTKCYICM